LILTALKTFSQSTGYSNLEFVENKGQWDEKVRFKANIGTGSFFLHRNGFTVLLHNPDDMRQDGQFHHGGFSQQRKTSRASSLVLHSHAYRVSFLNADENAEILPDKALPTYNNYYIGNDRSKWATECKIYQGITYKNIYPNIDLRYFTDNGVLKYNLIIHPGANPDQILLNYEGAGSLSIKKNELTIHTSVGDVKEMVPHSYELNDQGRKDIECSFFKASDHIIRFKLGNRSPNSTIIIDPTLNFASFSGSHADNWGFTATFGPDGSAFMGGIVLDNGYPVTTGAFQVNFAGGLSPIPWDVGILKLDPRGGGRVFGTYLGGSGNDYPHSMIADNQGNLIVYGRTSSIDFPVTVKVGPCGGRDIYVTKFNAGGTAIIGSLKIGGTADDGVNIDDQDETGGLNGKLGTESLILNYGDWSRGEVILDGANNIYVATCTQSADFPVTTGVFQPNFKGGPATQHGGGQDAAVIKISPTCTSLLWASFLGGSDEDVAFVMDVNPLTGNLYIGGATLSQDFPGIGAGSVQSRFQGNIDGFVSIISSDGSKLINSTYLGTSGNNPIYGVKFDKLGYPYVMGTTSGSWPVVNAAWSNPGSKQFVEKLQPDLSAVIYSTTFGSVNAKQPNISPVAFLVDRCQNVYVSGWGSFYAPIVPDPYNLAGTTGMSFTPDAVKPHTDGRDFYFIVIKRDATSLLYGTFFGQQDIPGKSLSEHVDGGTSRYDQNGVIYQAICANCDTDPGIIWPATPDAWATKNGDANQGGCNEAVVKISFNFAGVAANIKSLINGRYDSMGCVPLGVTFEDTIQNAKTYVWSFGDGTPDTTTTSYQVFHTYSNTGLYTVRLIAIDSSTCNIADTAYMHILGRNDRALLSFVALKQLPCESLSYVFDNTSTPAAGKPFSDTAFLWNFGDGSPTLPTGTQNVSHSYATAGTYDVSLTLEDTDYCNYPDSATQLLSVSPLVKAQFLTPAIGCVPYNAYFNNTSLAGEQFLWSFGDGTTSTDVSPTHLYDNVGTYTVKLVAIDSNTCNIIDSTQTTITVSNRPTASFTTTPVPPVANTPNVFSNSSIGAILFKWIFGDGDTAVRTNMDTVIHQYNSTGTFNACLVAINQNGCPDTACMSVETVVNPLFDVPNAFTPGRFGENSIVKVVGFGISQMDFKIYNRWGQLVFESNNQNIGWDGTFKGVPQPMDVYAYIVEVVFSDGKKGFKKGDITLIR
jgi:gliding motility-associated-like protein